MTAPQAVRYALIDPAYGGIYYLRTAFIRAASGTVFCGQIIRPLYQVWVKK